MDRAVTVLRRALMGAAVLWAALVPLVPFLVSHVQRSTPAWMLSLGAYAVGSAICHQLPERSFQLWSVQLPVCARCTGLYVGAALVSVWEGVAGARGRSTLAGTSAAPLARGGPRAVFAVAIAPTVATLAFEWTTGVMPANWIRALAGLPLGAALAWLAIRVN